MELKNKFMALGAAGVMAIGGAGLYAGVLTTTTDGKVGADTVALQASCASGAVIAPDPAVWDSDAMEFMYKTATVTYTSDLNACIGQVATVNVFDNTNGAELNVAVDVTIDGTTSDPNLFVVTFGTSTGGAAPGILGSIAAATYDYGIVIQSP